MYDTQFSPEEVTFRTLKGWQWIRDNHGSLFDRGSADSYYGRNTNPHYGGVGGSSGERITTLSKEEIEEYQAGYNYNEQFGEKKSY
jgi:hypothetical protein